MRILAIDYGNTRTGIAVTDPLGITVYGLKTIETKIVAPEGVDTTKAKDRRILKELEEIIAELKPEKIVIGMPYNENGTSGERVEKTKKFKHKIECKFPGVEIAEQDERYTTIEAHSILNTINVKKKKKKSVVDQLAAVVILQSYLKENNM